MHSYFDAKGRVYTFQSLQTETLSVGQDDVVVGDDGGDDWCCVRYLMAWPSSVKSQ